MPKLFASFNFLERKEMINLSSLHFSAPTVTVNTASDNNSSFSGLITAGAVGGLFTGATFNNSPVNVSISLQSSAKAFVKIKAHYCH